MRHRLVVLRHNRNMTVYSTAVSSRRYTFCDLVTLTFELIFIGGQGIVIDYLCVKFGDFGLSRFGFIVRTDRCADANDCYIDVTIVGVSKLLI